MDQCHTAREDSGFTLTETLVVIAITGAIAAIAVPLFINQRKQAGDDITVRSVVTAGEALTRASQDFPGATSASYRLTKTGNQATVFLDLNGNGTLQEDREPFEKVNLENAKKVELRVLSPAPGTFTVYGWNPDGREYTKNTAAAAYDSSTSGLVRGVHDSRYALK